MPHSIGLCCSSSGGGTYAVGFSLWSYLSYQRSRPTHLALAQNGRFNTYLTCFCRRVGPRRAERHARLGSGRGCQILVSQKVPVGPLSTLPLTLGTSAEQAWRSAMGVRAAPSTVSDRQMRWLVRGCGSLRADLLSLFVSLRRLPHSKKHVAEEIPRLCIFRLVGKPFLGGVMFGQ
jgi:hypothetical protein